MPALQVNVGPWPLGGSSPVVTTPRTPRHDGLVIEAYWRLVPYGYMSRQRGLQTMSNKLTPGLSRDLASQILDRAATMNRANQYEIALKSVLIGTMSGILAVALVSIGIGSPNTDAVAGAVIGGGGALAGVLVYLLRKWE